jgi:hypothetical protein
MECHDFQFCLSLDNLKIMLIKLLFYCRLDSIHYILIYLPVGVWIMKSVFGMLILQTVLESRTSVISFKLSLVPCIIVSFSPLAFLKQH